MSQAVIKSDELGTLCLQDMVWVCLVHPKSILNGHSTDAIQESSDKLKLLPTKAHTSLNRCHPALPSAPGRLYSRLHERTDLACAGMTQRSGGKDRQIPIVFQEL